MAGQASPFAGESRRGLIEKAGAKTELRFEGTWDGAPMTEVVLIGDLDEATVHRALWACSSRV